jgi:hypothetical protein
VERDLLIIRHMSLQQIILDAPTLKLILSIVGGLLLIAMVRIVFLLRTNTRLRESTAKMEKQVLTQHSEILAARQDSNAWRGEMQRVFDAFRAEFSKRLAESEQRYQDILKLQNSVTKPTAPAPASPPAPVAAKPPPPPSVMEQATEPAAMPPVPALSLS